MDIEWNWFIAIISLVLAAIPIFCMPAANYNTNYLIAQIIIFVLSFLGLYIICSILIKHIKGPDFSIFSLGNLLIAAAIIWVIGQIFLFSDSNAETKFICSKFGDLGCLGMPLLSLGISIVLFVIITIVSLLIANWRIIIAVIVYGVIIACLLLYKNEKKEKDRAEMERQEQLRQAEWERQEQLRQAEQERQEQLRQAEREREREWQEHLDRLQQAIQKAILRQGFFNLKCRGNTIMSIEKNNLAVYEMTKSPIIIDTNIWMDDDLNCFFKQLFYCCQINKVPVVIPGEVYEEIVRMTDKRNHYDNTEKVLKARIARKRILEFDNADLLYIDNLRIMHYESAYADPAIIELCKKSVRQAKQQNGFFYLLTNDKDLQLRVKHLSGDNSNKHCRILSIVATEYAQSDYAKNFQPSIPADFHRTDDIFNYLN